AAEVSRVDELGKGDVLNALRHSAPPRCFHFVSSIIQRFARFEQSKIIKTNLQKCPYGRCFLPLIFLLRSEKIFE
ncbi:MAG: hypothetical protein IIY48_03165, partial [Clostridia bacterium]|nr:hypothetical protein [Clostridia bacterium]MBQ1529178.1 hypothetical protein [Clostridia bacterium]